MYESKIFSNGSTTLPKLVREAPGVKAGDTVRYVIHEDGVQVLRTPSVSPVPYEVRYWNVMERFTVENLPTAH